MSRPPTSKAPTKDMYWFAHGGIESSTDKCLNQRSTTPGECEDESSDSTSPTLRSLTDRRGPSDEPKLLSFVNSVDSGNFSGPSSLDVHDRIRNLDKHIAAEERRKQLWEAEQERNDAVLRKHMEREAALEARRNANRSTISFAFGSSIPRNVDFLQSGDSEKISRNASGLLHKEENYELLPIRRSVSPPYSSGYNLHLDSTSPLPISLQSNVNYERKAFSPPCWLVGSGALIGDDVMSRSMTAAVPAPRGRRKNDLMPTVPYDRTAAPKSSSSGTTRKRSVSMTRLDQLAQPRRHYVEANKANSTVSSGALSMHKDTIKSPTRPLSSASEQSGGSGRLGSSTNRRVRSSPRKPRPVSIAGTIPDHRTPAEIKVSPLKKNFTSSKKSSESKKSAVSSTNKPAVAKSAEKPKLTVEKTKPLAEKSKSTPRSTSTPKSTKQPAVKQTTPSPKIPPKTASPKTPTAKKTVTNKKKADIMIASQPPAEVVAVPATDVIKAASPPPSSPPPDSAVTDADRNNAKRIISEEEAKTALAEKRRLAREQAEKEAELERQRQEELRKQEEERLRMEEEEQKRMEEEQLRLLEEHSKLEEEKLRKAIEENERKEEEERQKREEEQRLKAEQEKKAHEEAEKQRIELEEKLRKEEEERAERKKRLEKIMSRTRGKTSGTSPSGSLSGSEQFDSSENQQENVSSGANSLESTGTGENESGPASLDCPQDKSEPVSDGASMEAHPTYEVTSDNESLNDIIMPKSETASQDNSLVIIPTKDEFNLLAEPESHMDDAVMIPSVTHELQSENVIPHIQLIDQTVVSQFVEDGKNEFNQNIEPLKDSISETHSSDKTIETSNSEIIPEVVEPFFASHIQEVDHFPPTSSESTAVDHSDVILSFGQENIEASSKPLDMSNILQSTNVSQSFVDYVSERIDLEEQNSHFSTSSDMKLPDPIYETSEDGSVSSEKHQPDFAFSEDHQHESQLVTDEVFNEKEYEYPEMYQKSNPFEGQEFNNSASNLIDAYESQFDVGGMQDSIYAYEINDMSGAIEQPREVGEEHVSPPRSSTSSIPQTIDDLGNSQTNTNVFLDFEGNKENVCVETEIPSQNINPFAAEGDFTENKYEADKENVRLNPFDDKLEDMPKNQLLPEPTNLEVNDSQIHGNLEDHYYMQQQNNILEQTNFEIHSGVGNSSEVTSQDFKFSDVTIIKAEGSDDCIGIISSIDNDHISNNLVQQSMQNELMKSNFEYSSITDSEDSSLDSNLSQIMTVEVNEQNSVGLNKIETQTHSSESTVNNVLEEIPFNEPAMNGNSTSNANGDHYPEPEILSNGHRLESANSNLEQIADYVQLDSKHISSVDHPKTNIFDNVAAVDFGKMSPDPFLAKGTSNQISGNPFLLQDDQNKVLMNPDFFN